MTEILLGKYKMVELAKKRSWLGEGSPKRPLEPTGGSVRQDIAAEVARLARQFQMPIYFVFSGEAYHFDPAQNRFGSAKQGSEYVRFVVDNMNADLWDQEEKAKDKKSTKEKISSILGKLLPRRNRE